MHAELESPGDQQPLELILARNLLSSISTPGFLVDKDGMLVFFNEAAGALLGKHYEETGKMGPDDWSRAFGPYDRKGRPMDIDELPLTIALREGCPVHDSLTLQSFQGDRREVEVSALPLVAANGGFRGALAIFWPTGARGKR
ncbi:MAG TPA: PAS domain-containing protein [Solirubrobacteraceae bacterium]|nr:PAS domain-containing protein [Solirubrobacteraceae bacterium]